MVVLCKAVTFSSHINLLYTKNVTLPYPILQQFPVLRIFQNCVVGTGLHDLFQLGTTDSFFYASLEILL